MKPAVTLTALAILLPLGCGDLITGPGTLHDIRIINSAELASLLVNDTARVQLAGRDQYGAGIAAEPVSWQSTNPTAVLVDPLGFVIGKGPGSAVIIASVGDLSASVTITVAGTRHRWAITASETWTLAGSPHVVQGRLSVGRPFGSLVTLTIEAGATVVFADTAGLTFGPEGGGRLLALGTPAAPITLRDTAASAVPGAWIGLTFRGRDSSELRNLTVSGCGRSRSDDQPRGCLILGHRIFGPSPTVLFDNVTVRDAAGGAVILQQQSRFAPGSSGLTVSNMQGHIATVPAGTAGTFPAGSFVGNDTNEVRLTGDTLRDSVAWGAAIPWVVLEPVYIEGPRRPLLTIPGGVTLPFAGLGSLVVGKNAGGGLRIGDTGGATTTLRGRNGGWAGVAFWAGASGSISNAVLENCGNFSDTGYGQACVSFIGNFSGTAPAPVLMDVTIRGATGFGVVAVGGGRFGDGSANVTITGTIRFGSPGAPLSFFRSSPASIPSGSYTGNAADTIYVSYGEVTRSETWRNRGVPYLILNGLLIAHAVNPILTLDPGVVLRFAPGGLLSVAWLATGGLRAIGTAAEPIILGSQFDHPGSWGGVDVGVHADTTTLFDYVIVEHSSETGFRLARDLGPFIQNTLVRRSTGCGITRLNGSTWATDFTAPALGNSFQDNEGPDQCGP